MFKSIQLWGTIALVGTILLLLWGIKTLYDKNVKLETDLRSKTAQLVSAQADIKTQQLSSQFGNWVNESYFKTTEEIRNENAKLKLDVANGTRRLRANATCLQSNVTTTGNTGSAENGLPRFTASAEQGWFDLNEGIPANAELYDKALATLDYWHDHWYELCGAKPK